MELLVYSTLLGYTDKSAKWIPLNIAAKEPWTGSQDQPMMQALGESPLGEYVWS